MPRPTDIPTQLEFAALVAWLQTRGLTATRTVAAIGATPQGRSMRQLAVLLKAELKRSQKA